MKLLPRKRAADQADRRQTNNIANQRGVFSYYANRSTQTGKTSNRAGQADSQRRWNWRYLPSLLAGLAILVSLVYLLTLDTNPRVVVANNQHLVALRPMSTYQRAAQEALASSWFNRNKLTLDSGQVARRLKRQFPEIEDVAVTLPLAGHQPLVELAIVQPALLIVAHNGRFVVAASGKAVATATDASASSLKDLPTVTDDSGLSLETGRAALPSDQVNFIQAVAAQLKAQKISLQTLTLPTSPNELDVRVQGLPYFIKFNTSSDARQQVGSFLAVKQRLDSQHVTPTSHGHDVVQCIFYDSIYQF